MQRFKLQRPSPAMAIACLALFVALGGGAWAAANLPRHSVGSRQLKKNAVTAKKLKKNAVNSAKVRNRSLKKIDFKAGQLPAGPQVKTVEYHLANAYRKLSIKSRTQLEPLFEDSSMRR